MRTATVHLLGFIILIGLPAASFAQAWGDEFSGTSVNTGDWNFETGGHGWGNNELQFYQAANASVSGGILTIQARHQTVGSNPYTSARLTTQGKRTFTYGQMEARIAGPSGAGLWPAFWMLGANIPTVPWPGCGEIDILEHINNTPTIFTTIHWNNAAGAYASWGPPGFAMNTFSSFHTYAIDWNSAAIRWYLDGATNGQAEILNNVNGTEEFHRPFFFILNLAVGGNWPGPPNTSTVMPANLLIDYVRVNGGGGTPQPTPTATSVPRATPTTAPRATPAPGGLLSLNRPATASSSENAGSTPNFAVDGNTGTRWSSAFSDPQWITVDLGATASITRVRLNWEAAFATAYSIQVSGNSSTWTTVMSVTGGDGGIDDHNMSTSGRYVRINGTSRATQYGYSLWELEVYGTAGSATPTPTSTPTATARARATATATARPRATPTSGAATLLSQGRPVAVSGSESPFLGPNAVDGNTGTRWSSAFSDPQWIYVDLGTPRNITRVLLNWEAAYGRSYSIQTSNDAVTWSPIFSTTTGNGGLDDLTGLTGNGRYVRMHGTARATQYGYSLWEFQVFGN
jgi:beta-glucanase (GH16 family)